MKPAAGFLSLAEELRFYILSFLSCRDILRCTSVCKAIRQTYLSSSGLQYIVELSGQRLLPVPNTDDHTPTSERLQLLRDKSHALFKVDFHSSKTVSIPRKLYNARKFVAKGDLYLWDHFEATALILPIPPKPSQQTIERNWSPRTLCSLPRTVNLDVFIDPAQNLIAVAHNISGGEQTLCVDLQALDGGGVHPQAAGRRLFLSGLPGYEHTFLPTGRAQLKNFGRYMALDRTVAVFDAAAAVTFEPMWQLQIWDWQHSTTSNSFLSDTLHNAHYDAIDFCFLGNNRLLVATGNLKIYSFEDMSQTPQLLACFVMPVTSPNIECLLSTDDIDVHSPQMQTMYTSDPKNRLLCLTTWGVTRPSPCQIYIISTRIFFDLDGMAAATLIPWEHWGPSNARIFQHPYRCKVHVSGNRVLQASTVGTPVLRVMDFSPLAVTNRQGLGRVVKQPSTIDVTGSTSLSRVVSDKEFSFDELENIWIDKDRIYLLTRTADWKREAEDSDTEDFPAWSSRLGIIDV
ncbi:hypothetical protein EDB19DRAFT_2028167 [Suillus lakei]|nr:hypothetical protein EDB19DRAFT_2028167 [Suillus lakei]